MEENKNREEELQSRREFFKKAAKAALPILGAVVLSGAAPQILNAATPPYNCDGTCNSTCYGACDGGCERSCKSTCSISCEGRSAGSSGYGCHGCDSYCFSNCSGTCEKHCNGSCSGNGYKGH